MIRETVGRERPRENALAVNTLIGETAGPNMSTLKDGEELNLQRRWRGGPGDEYRRLHVNLVARWFCSPNTAP